MQLRRILIPGLLVALAACGDATGADHSFEGCSQVRTMPGTSPTTGELRSGSCRLPADLSNDRALVDYYRLEITATRVVELTLASEDFYPFLLLLNPEGQALRWDSGEEVAYIEVTLNPGVYYVGATSTYGDNLGQYLLHHAMGPQ